MRPRVRYTHILIGVIGFLILGRYIGSPVSIVIVAGTSMRPSLEIGDLAFLVKMDFDVGDLVLWCRDNLNCILHRVYEVNQTHVTTKGDANIAPDPPITIDKVEYTALFTIPSYIWIPITVVLIYLVDRYESREEGIR